MEQQDYWLNETVALLTFSLMKGVGYWTIRNLALQNISFKQVLKANSSNEFVEYLKQAGCKSANQVVEVWQNSTQELWKEAIKLYRDLKNQNIEVIHFGQQHFPQHLREINEPPKWLFVQGNISLLHQPALTLVGTRNPSEDGKFLAQYIGSCLPYFPNVVTVSGLANGIDQIIHKQSIRFEVPTIAFVGTGILLNYPVNSDKLRLEICKNGGAIVSEYLPSESYSSENFVRRNRLQAGLARVVIPVEWKPRGGTAHTVRYAKAANRQIICLKLPDWDSSHPELSIAKDLGATIFTIPGQESEFIHTVQRSTVIEPNQHEVDLSKTITKSEITQPKSQAGQLEIPLWN